MSEIRCFAGELRAADPRKLSGHAVVWGDVADLGPFREEIQRGAFADTLNDAARDVWALWAHDISKPLASRKSGTLQLAEDDHGLRFDMALGDTSWSTDAYTAVKSGVVRGVSFRFMVPSGGDVWQKRDGALVRTVKRAELLEISPTVLPAYGGTDVSARSVADVLAGARLDSGVAVRDLLAQMIDLERMAY